MRCVWSPRPPTRPGPSTRATRSPSVWAAARSCHVALGCRQYSLFDFRVDPEGRPWFLEAGLYCSFASTSVLAVMAGAAGIALPELFDRMLARAVRAGTTADRLPV